MLRGMLFTIGQLLQGRSIETEVSTLVHCIPFDRFTDKTIRYLILAVESYPRSNRWMAMHCVRIAFNGNSKLINGAMPLLPRLFVLARGWENTGDENEKWAAAPVIELFKTKILGVLNDTVAKPETSSKSFPSSQ